MRFCLYHVLDYLQIDKATEQQVFSALLKDISVCVIQLYGFSLWANAG